MTNEIALRDEIQTMDDIARLWITGTRNPTAIAKQLKMSRAEVLKYIDQYKEIVRNDPETKERAKEALFEADAAINLVIEESWALANSPAIDAKTKATILKNTGDLEVKRVEMLQKAGLYNDAALGDELAEMEEKAEAIKELLKEVAANFPEARELIQRGLMKIFDQPVGVDVPGEVVVTTSA